MNEEIDDDEKTEEEKVEEMGLGLGLAGSYVGADGTPLVQLLDSLQDIEVVDKNWRAGSVGLIGPPVGTPIVDGIGPNGTPIGFVPLTSPSCPAANAVAWLIDELLLQTELKAAAPLIPVVEDKTAPSLPKTGGRLALAVCITGVGSPSMP
jgi:hypothetical protein